MAETSVRLPEEGRAAGARHAARLAPASAASVERRTDGGAKASAASGKSSAKGNAASGKSSAKGNVASGKSSAKGGTSGRGGHRGDSGGARASGRRSGRGRARRGLLELLRQGWFYRIYFALLALCAVGLAVMLVVLHGVMGEYEQTRPVHAAEDVFAQVQARDWNALRALDESAARMKFEGSEQYAQYMRELTGSGEFTLKSVLSIDENEPKYSVLLDGKKFAEFTLEHSGERTAHNFEGWKLKSFSTTAIASEAFTFTVPSDSTVEINGVALTPEDAIETGIEAVDSANLPEGVAAPTLIRYSVFLFSGQPENVRVLDKNGAELPLHQDSERAWSCDLPDDDAQIKAKCEDGAVKWGRRLAAFTSNDYDKIDLSNACVNPSPARTYIRNMENQWAAAHSGYDFENIETHNYHIYSDDCFSCEISFDYVIHYSREDKTYPTAYTLYFAKDGGTFKLYSFTIN